MKAARVVVECGLAVMCVANPARAQDARSNGAISRDGIIQMDLGVAVSNAPYSAEGTTTTSSILPSGSHATGMSTSKVFRDGQGRERREQTLIGIAVLGASAQTIQPVVTISDPVSRTTYTLDVLTRTARRVPYEAGRNIQVRSFFGARGGTFVASMPRVAEPPPFPPPPPPAPAPPPGRDDADGARARGVVIVTQAGGAPGAARYDMQLLGTKPVDGETATGRVTKSTLADGTEVIDEQWTSTDLKVTVMSKHHDPRTGDVLYKLTNIVRGEPDTSLFSVPADYTVVDDTVALPRTPGQ